MKMGLELKTEIACFANLHSQETLLDQAVTELQQAKNREQQSDALAIINAILLVLESSLEAFSKVIETDRNKKMLADSKEKAVIFRSKFDDLLKQYWKAVSPPKV